MCSIRHDCLQPCMMIDMFMRGREPVAEHIAAMRDDALDRMLKALFGQDYADREDLCLGVEDADRR
jgi:hypothetical protein